MPFDPKKHIIRVQGNREYLPVSARLVWFRQEHPDWSIVTPPIEINLDKQYAIFSASIMNTDGKIIATGTKMENVKGFPDFLEKAETGAVGRALAMTGFGTQFAPELEEADRFADAPIGPSPANRPPANVPANRTGNRFATSPGNNAPSNGRGRPGPIRSPQGTPITPPLPANGDLYDDPQQLREESSRNEVSQNRAPQSAAPADANSLSGNCCSVSGCPNVLTPSQMTMTKQKYGRPLCLLHQRDPALAVAGTEARH